MSSSAWERLEDFLAKGATRVVLSVLILLSLLLPTEDFRQIFLAIFATELTLRAILFCITVRRDGFHRRHVNELGFLLLDLVATLSFLDWKVQDTEILRLFRLTRLLLLIGYWRPYLSDLWTITWRRERRFQLAFVTAVVVFATVAGGAAIQALVRSQAHDFDGDGAISEQDDRFSARLWWVFRQLQDPGNLVESTDDLTLLIVSLFLTVAGLLLISFIIGVGTTVVEELVVVGRQRRMGLRGHLVVIGGGPHAHFLLEELAGFQAKRVLRRRIVLFGTEDERPQETWGPALRDIHYRSGDPASPAELERADVDRAALVIVLGDEKAGDAMVVSRVLAVRQLNPTCRIVADVARPQNRRSVREAGGPNTEVVLTRQFVGLFLASELVFPGLDAVYRELLTSQGQEFYLVPWSCEEGRIEDPEALLRRGLRRAGVLPLGLQRSAADGEATYDLNPVRGECHDDVEGLLVLARSEEVAERFLEAAADEHEEDDSGAEHRVQLQLETSRELAGLQRLLVCGFREEIGALIQELGQFVPGLSVHLMVAPGHVERVRHEILRLHPHPAGGRFREVSDVDLEFATDEQVLVRLRLLVGDPGSDRDLVSIGESDHELAETDAVLFVADPSWGLDPDAKSSLGVLKLFGRLRDAPETFRSGFRAVGELQQAGKGELLENRLRELRRAEAAPMGQGERCAIVSTEKLRHYLLGQVVVVPGISQVYAELLRASGQSIVKLVPKSCGEESVRFGDLVLGLASRGLIPLAVERAGEDGRQACVNPGLTGDGADVPVSEFTGVFCLASAHAVASEGEIDLEC
ncbi:MAG: NAD-binding protein [Acidobacteriota bacterium]